MMDIFQETSEQDDYEPEAKIIYKCPRFRFQMSLWGCQNYAKAKDADWYKYCEPCPRQLLRGRAPRDAEWQPKASRLTPQGVAREYKIPLGTLGMWRSLGQGPRWIKEGYFVYYQRGDLDRFFKTYKGPSFWEEGSTDGRLTRADLVNRYGVPLRTLDTWRARGQGPEWFREFGRVFYRPEAVEAYFKHNTVPIKDGRLTSIDIEDKYGLAPGTIHVWRRRGAGPKWFKAHGRVYYRPEDVEAFFKTYVKRVVRRLSD
jgi:hypothetical protein